MTRSGGRTPPSCGAFSCWTKNPAQGTTSYSTRTNDLGEVPLGGGPTAQLTGIANLRRRAPELRAAGLEMPVLIGARSAALSLDAFTTVPTRWRHVRLASQLIGLRPASTRYPQRARILGGDRPHGRIDDAVSAVNTMNGLRDGKGGRR